MSIWGGGPLLRKPLRERLNDLADHLRETMNRIVDDYIFEKLGENFADGGTDLGKSVQRTSKKY